MLLWITWHKLQSCACPSAWKLALSKGDMTWPTVAVCICNKERANSAASQKVDQLAKIQAYIHYIQNSPRKPNTELVEVQNWKINA